MSFQFWAMLIPIWFILAALALFTYHVTATVQTWWRYRRVRREYRAMAQEALRERRLLFSLDRDDLESLATTQDKATRRIVH